ncbi:MAG: hypothetical protein ACPG7F_20680 [Aggregatilineales bacterium]
MYDDELPDFEKRKTFKVMPYMTKVLAGGGDASALLKLIDYEDGHFRAIFKSTYFVLQGDATEASKSQWSTLKKKMKRHDSQVFIFKEHGSLDCSTVNAPGAMSDKFECYYLDFGFFTR